MLWKNMHTLAYVIIYTKLGIQVCGGIAAVKINYYRNWASLWGLELHVIINLTNNLEIMVSMLEDKRGVGGGALLCSYYLLSEQN